MSDMVGLGHLRVVYSTTCDFCGGAFIEGEQVAVAFAWDRMEHQECAGMSRGQLDMSIQKIPEGLQRMIVGEKGPDIEIEDGEPYFGPYRIVKFDGTEEPF